MKKNFTLPKFFLFLIPFLVFTLAVQADEAEDKSSRFGFDFYGFVRTDFYYNSRDCVAGVNDIFNLYPYDVELDSAGEDLNAYSSSGFFAFITRLGLDIKAPNVGRAEATAKIEVDFGGSGLDNTMLRIRHAYMNLNWKSGSNLVLGQTWHPLFGEVAPSITNISTGAPFQPFSRAPQVRYSYKTEGGVKFSLAALWQLQYKSNGPADGSKSISYQLNSGIPEFNVGIDYYTPKFLLGAGANMLNIQPRTSSTVGDEVYKVDELMTAISAEIHLRYRSNGWLVSAKSIYASALDHTTMLGGYGVTAIDATTGKQSYTPLHNSSTWINVVYEGKWRPTLFVGYVKNLGASKELVGDIYGNATDIDQLIGCNLGLTYTIKHWAISLEYSTTAAWYGDVNSRGAVENTHSVYNHRLISAVALYF